MLDTDARHPTHPPRAAGPIVCCSSPERFLRGGRGGALEARPIKGTAPRVNGDAAADAAAAAALARSEKVLLAQLFLEKSKKMALPWHYFVSNPSVIG